MMIDLSQYFPQLKCRNANGQSQIYCHTRRTWLVATPEEVVRQTAILHLIDLGYSDQLIAVERQIRVNQRLKRFDVAVADQKGDWCILVECKAPKYPLSQQVIDQISAYNQTLRVPTLWMTNGAEHLLYSIDHEKQRYQLIDELPLPAPRNTKIK